MTDDRRAQGGRRSALAAADRHRPGARRVRPPRQRVHAEYPRPQLARRAWLNLNGRWDYAVQDSGAPRPTRFDGTILVPFPIQSLLSSVLRAVTPTQRLWYRRTFRLPPAPRGSRWLLHFGAVDWEAAVFVTGQPVGTHRGGS